MDPQPNHRDNSEDQDSPQSGNSNGILDGVANILGRLGELAEKGEQLRRQVSSDEVAGEPGGVFDFSMKFGSANPGGRSAGGRSTRPGQVNRSAQKPVAPFKKPKSAQTQTPIDKTRNAHVDLYEEEDHILIIAEMPGVSSESIEINVDGNNVSIQGSNAHTLFVGEAQLPEGSYDVPTHSLNNGILEIRLALLK